MCVCVCVYNHLYNYIFTFSIISSTFPSLTISGLITSTVTCFLVGSEYIDIHVHVHVIIMCEPNYEVIGFEAWAKLAPKWLVCAPLRIHLEPINKELMLLVTI